MFSEYVGDTVVCYVFKFWVSFLMVHCYPPEQEHDLPLCVKPFCENSWIC